MVLAKEKYGLRGREISEHEATFIPFSAYTRMSGVDIDGRQLRKGATEAIVNFVEELGGKVPADFTETIGPHLAHGRNSAGGGGRASACWVSST